MIGLGSDKNEYSGSKGLHLWGIHLAILIQFAFQFDTLDIFTWSRFELKRPRLSAPASFLLFLVKGRMAVLKRMIFRKSSKGGREGYFQSKKFIADFGPLYRAFKRAFRKKMHCDFPKMRGARGGDSKAVWNFSKKSSVLVPSPVP